MHFLKSINLAHKIFLQLHKIRPQLKSKSFFNGFDLISKPFDLLMTLKKVLIIKVFFFVNKLYARYIFSSSAKVSELLRIQPLIVLIPEMPVTLK